jgi:hypothetical protein
MTLTLPAAGFRFTHRPGDGWAWRENVLPGDLDATDMSGPEFEDAVRKSEKAA